MKNVVTFKRSAIQADHNIHTIWFDCNVCLNQTPRIFLQLPYLLWKNYALGEAKLICFLRVKLLKKMGQSVGKKKNKSYILIIKARKSLVKLWQILAKVWTSQTEDTKMMNRWMKWRKISDNWKFGKVNRNFQKTMEQKAKEMKNMECQNFVLFLFRFFKF